MEMVVTVTLLKDSDGQYSLNLNKPTVTVSPLYEDAGSFDTVNVRWLLREDEANPNYPNNAKQLTVTFNTLPTPFTLTSEQGLPSTEVYVAGAFSPGVVTADVQDAAVDAEKGAVSLYKYTIQVDTHDGKQLVLDPHVRVRRSHVTRGDIFSR